MQPLQHHTNQAAIAALFRVVNRYVGNLAPMPGVFPDYPAPVIRNTDTGRDDPDAVGHAAATAHRRAPGHQHPQHVVAALARLAEAGEPVPCPRHSFAEYALKPNPETKKKDVVWFALDNERSLFAFGIEGHPTRDRACRAYRRL